MLSTGGDRGPVARAPIISHEDLAALRISPWGASSARVDVRVAWVSVLQAFEKTGRPAETLRISRLDCVSFPSASD